MDTSLFADLDVDDIDDFAEAPSRAALFSGEQFDDDDDDDYDDR